MFKIFATTRQGIKNGRDSKDLINQAITHSMLKGDDALKTEHYQDASKFYKYALRLAEMQFGKEDSIAKNLNLLLTRIEERLNQGVKRAKGVAQTGWQPID